MDAADIQRAVTEQGPQVGTVEQALTTVFQAICELCQHMTQLAANNV